MKECAVDISITRHYDLEAVIKLPFFQQVQKTNDWTSTGKTAVLIPGISLLPPPKCLKSKDGSVTLDPNVSSNDMTGVSLDKGTGMVSKKFCSKLKELLFQMDCVQSKIDAAKHLCATGKVGSKQLNRNYAFSALKRRQKDLKMDEECLEALRQCANEGDIEEDCELILNEIAAVQEDRDRCSRLESTV